MKKLIIGHRGTGKSTFLKRHQSYFPQINHVDLDLFIQESEKKPISQIFSDQGESEFRKLEIKYFKELAQKDEIVISLGAGFLLNTIDHQILEKFEIIYLSRRTDKDGRVFLNRPRLNKNLSAIEEYLIRYSEREPLFRQYNQWVYHVPEGLNRSSFIEEIIFKKTQPLVIGYYTLSSEPEFQVQKYLNRFELRSDILSMDEMKTILSRGSGCEFIVSVRRKKDKYTDYQNLRTKKIRLDWPLELGDVPRDFQPDIISVHGNNFDESFKLIEKYTNQKYSLKFCPVVDNLKQLQQGFEWQQQDPENRNFLPRTPNKFDKSLWRWFRIIMLNKQNINFIQSKADFDDQPSLYQYFYNRLATESTYGAVVGYPVHHSRTPEFQGHLCHYKKTFIDVPVKSNDLREYLDIFKLLKIDTVAVTAPLKIEAQKLVSVQNTVQGINTLKFVNNQWIGTTTDHFGFRDLLESAQVDLLTKPKIYVWGGAGVLSALQKIYPEIKCFSSRTGELKTGLTSEDTIISPDVVIWAAPRSVETQFPPEFWSPHKIIDLNYVENSMGLEYAQKISGVEYYSGVKMFESQAIKQHEFWNNKDQS